MYNWINEIDLSYESQPISMGIRKLGGEPWLIADDNKDDELALKLRLSADSQKIVFIAKDGAESAGLRICKLLVDSGIELINSDKLHPLHRAGLSIQEDLCLLQRTEEV